MFLKRTTKRDKTKDFESLDFTDEDLIHLLENENLKLSSCRGAKFSGLDLIDMDMSGADLRDCDFKGAYIINCNFTNCWIDGADFTDAKLHNVTLSNTIGCAIGLDNQQRKPAEKNKQGFFDYSVVARLCTWRYLRLVLVSYASLVFVGWLVDYHLWQIVDVPKLDVLSEKVEPSPSSRISNSGRSVIFALQPGVAGAGSDVVDFMISYYKPSENKDFLSVIPDYVGTKHSVIQSSVYDPQDMRVALLTGSYPIPQRTFSERVQDSWEEGWQEGLRRKGQPIDPYTGLPEVLTLANQRMAEGSSSVVIVLFANLHFLFGIGHPPSELLLDFQKFVQNGGRVIVVSTESSSTKDYVEYFGKVLSAELVIRQDFMTDDPGAALERLRKVLKVR